MPPLRAELADAFRPQARGDGTQPPSVLGEAKASCRLSGWVRSNSHAHSNSSTRIPAHKFVSSFMFLSSGGWVKTKLKLPHFHVSKYMCQFNPTLPLQQELALCCCRAREHVELPARPRRQLLTMAHIHRIVPPRCRSIVPG